MHNIIDIYSFTPMYLANLSQTNSFLANKLFLFVTECQALIREIRAFPNLELFKFCPDMDGQLRSQITLLHDPIAVVIKFVKTLLILRIVG